MAKLANSISANVPKFIARRNITMIQHRNKIYPNWNAENLSFFLLQPAIIINKQMRFDDKNIS